MSRFADRLLRLALGALLLSASPTWAQDAPRSTARLVGTIRDDRGAPVANARATLSHVGGGVLSSDSGQFVFDSLPPGNATLEVRALGFAPARAAVRLVAGSTVTITLNFRERMTVLSEINVRVKRYERNIEDFERRRRVGVGDFMGPEELARRAPNRLATVVSHLPGTQLQCYQGNQCLILFRRVGGAPQQDTAGTVKPFIPNFATSDRCEPAIFLDGRLDRTGQAFTLSSKEIAAIEVYTSTSSRPPEFALANRECGVLVVWTDPYVLDPTDTTDSRLRKQCGGRTNWCYLRRWWPLAAFVGIGVGLAVR